MLVPILNSWLSMLNGSAMIWMMRCASLAAAGLWSISPDWMNQRTRPTVPRQNVGSRNDALRRVATSRNSASPAE